MLCFMRTHIHIEHDAVIERSQFEGDCVSGIDDFDTVLEEDIVSALPFLKRNGLPYYVHAEIPDDTLFQVSYPAG